MPRVTFRQFNLSCPRGGGEGGPRLGLLAFGVQASWARRGRTITQGVQKLDIVRGPLAQTSPGPLPGQDVFCYHRGSGQSSRSRTLHQCPLGRTAHGAQGSCQTPARTRSACNRAHTTGMESPSREVEDQVQQENWQRGEAQNGRKTTPHRMIKQVSGKSNWDNVSRRQKHPEGSNETRRYKYTNRASLLKHLNICIPKFEDRQTRKPEPRVQNKEASCLPLRGSEAREQRRRPEAQETSGSDADAQESKQASSDADVGTVQSTTATTTTRPHTNESIGAHGCSFIIRMSHTNEPATWRHLGETDNHGTDETDGVMNSTPRGELQSDKLPGASSTNKKGRFRLRPTSIDGTNPTDNDNGTTASADSTNAIAELRLERLQVSRPEWR